jgi:hypothetical protein
MPSQAKSQQRAAQEALLARYGAIPPEELRGTARHLYESKTLMELEAIADNSKFKFEHAH